MNYAYLQPIMTLGIKQKKYVYINNKKSSIKTKKKTNRREILKIYYI